MARHLFTPIVGTDRARFFISTEDDAKVTRGPGVKGIVTDLDTGKKYRVEGRSCSIPECYCDATAEEVEATVAVPVSLLAAIGLEADSLRSALKTGKAQDVGHAAHLLLDALARLDDAAKLPTPGV